MSAVQMVDVAIGMLFVEFWAPGLWHACASTLRR